MSVSFVPVSSSICNRLSSHSFDSLSSKDNFDNFTSLEVLQSHGAKNHTEKIANLINRLARVEATGDRV